MDIDSAAALAIARAAAATEEYAESPVPAEVAGSLEPELSAFAFVGPGIRNRLLEHLPHASEVDAVLQASWAAAREAGALRFYEGKVVFPLFAMRADGETPIEVSLREGDPERSGGKPWYASYVNAYVAPHAAQAVAPSKAIEQFAWFGPWDELLGQLAEAALPEPWDFGGPDEHGHRFSILNSYLRTTFYRLEAEGKIRVAEDRSFAAFNTGLVDSRFDDICACFEPGFGTFEWRFVGFAASGSRALKKRVIRSFNPLPQPARYFDRLEDLLFDLDRALVIDYDHILLDNIGRLPLAFLDSELDGSAEASKLVRALDAAGPDEREGLLEELADVVDTDSRLFRRLRNRMEDAVDIARRRVRWNFKTAIPSYYPRANAMSLLLPLSLIDDAHVDAALVVQLTESGNYQGQTILTMEQAYKHARVICRPDSDWLTPLSA
ncbi:DUF3825 domain-containing protein [Arabiibacter massiliensis]|uniref:DUF3825 domain-containing protein n=1 Tax=Arabiibacter massiliensis TaxID=1870985 RepID=UPI00155B1AA3|nr:DUF3825 domain-containing protein [Arabiibacter massiliensis]